MKIESLKSWRPIGIYITSGDGEDDKPKCALCIYLRWWMIRIPLPQIYMPHARRVVPNWDAATVLRLGRDYYIDYSRRDYGFMFSGEGYLSVYLGRQTDDSSTEQCWSCFLPWTQWRFVRHSLYDLSGQQRCAAVSPSSSARKPARRKVRGRAAHSDTASTCSPESFTRRRSGATAASTA